MARPTTRNSVDAPLVSAERRAELKRLADKKVEEDLRKQQEDALIKQFEQEAREQEDPDEERRPVTIDLPPTHDRITLDGTIYLHGATYQVTKAKYDVLAEQMQRAWYHEAEIEGKRMERYRRPRGVVLRPGDNITTSNLLRV